MGEDEPVRVLKNGLWLLENGSTRFAVLLAPTRHYGEVSGIQFRGPRVFLGGTSKLLSRRILDSVSG